MGVTRTIDIDHLVVDWENPRFEAVSNESDALYSILDDQSLIGGNKILNLAQSIAENGLNPSERLVVSPIEGTDTYRVREGNRRVTAIKLSIYPELIPESFNYLASRFSSLSDAMQTRKAVECYVNDDEREIREILTLRHGGENGGIGIVRWNTTQKARFSQEGNQQSARAISLVESIRKLLGDGEVFRAATFIPATNIGRLISTPEVRQALGIDVSGNVARYLGGHDDLLLDVLLTVRRKGVAPIYNRDGRIGLIEEARRRVEPSGESQRELQFDDMGLEDETDYSSESRPVAQSDYPAVSPISSDDSEREHDGDLDLQPSNEQAHSSTIDESTNLRTTADDDSLTPTDTESVSDAKHEKKLRRKPVSRSVDKRMFGHTLRPKGTNSNDIYRAIDWIDSQYLSDQDGNSYLLPVLGMSLRLLMETVAHEYYQSIGEDHGDDAFSHFMKDIARPAIKNRVDSSARNDLALASEWIDHKYNFEAISHKWAHGTMNVDRDALIKQSELVALIIDEIWTDGGARG